MSEAKPLKKAFSVFMSALLVITLAPIAGAAQVNSAYAAGEQSEAATAAATEEQAATLVEFEEKEASTASAAAVAPVAVETAAMSVPSSDVTANAPPAEEGTVTVSVSDLFGDAGSLGPEMLSESKAVTHKLDPYITGFTVVDDQGEDLTTVEAGTNVTVRFGWLIQGAVHGGTDEFTYQLPVNFKMAANSAGKITKGEKGPEIGTYLVDTDGKVTISYNVDYNTDKQTTTNYMEITGVAQYGSDADNHEIKFEWTNGSKVIKVTNPGDFEIAKRASMYYPEGKLSHDTYIDYTVDITSELGTNGQLLTITDTLSAVNWQGTPKLENFSLKSGNAEIAIAPVVNGKQFTIENVPALPAGGSYQLTYRAVFEQDKNSNGQNTMSFDNKAVVQSGDIAHEATTSSQKSAILGKYGQDFDQNTKRVRWDINISTQGASVAGYTVEDVSEWAYDTSDFRLYADEVEVARGDQIPNLTFDESSKKFSFTIPDTEGVSRWKLVYYANIEGAAGDKVEAKNSVVLKRTGTDETWTYGAIKEGIVPSGGEVSVDKSSGGIGAAQDGYLPVNWNTRVNYSYSKTAAQGDYWIVDKIGSAQLQTNSNGWERRKYDKDHYGIASEIQAALEKNLRVTVLENGAEVQKTYADLADRITVFYYSSDNPSALSGDAVSSSDGTAHVRSFQIKIDNSVRPLKVESSYSTRFNLEHYSKGESWQFLNQLSADGVYDDEVQSYKEELTSAAGVSKQVYLGTIWVSDSATVAYEDIKGLGYQMKYRLLVTLPEGQSSFEVADQLPEGLAYVDGSVDVGAYTEATHSRSGLWGNKSVSYDAASNRLTVRVDGIGSGSQQLKDRNTVVVEYKVKVSESIAKLPGATIESNGLSYFASASLENTATVDGKSDSLTLDVTQEQKVLDKTAEQIMDGGAYTSTVHYTATINPSAFDLLPAGDVLTLTDTITSTALDFKLVPSSVKLYRMNDDGSKGAEVDPQSVAIQQPVTSGVETKQVFTIGVLDETAYVLEYDYTVDKRAASNAATQGTLSNTIALEGKASSASNAFIQGISVRATSNHAALDLMKVDAKNNTKYLKATFQLAEYKDGQFQDVRPFTADGDKGASFDYFSESETLKGNTLYRIVETEAPAGYDLDKTPFYFIIKGNIQDVRSGDIDATQLTVSSDEEAKSAAKAPAGLDINMLSPNSGSYFEIKNEEAAMTEFSVEKIWNDHDNQDGTRPESVTIKLLANGQETDKSIVLNADNGWEGSFTNLRQYDDSGTAITYTIAETAVDKYAATIVGNAADGFTVTNTYVATISFPVTKVWNDSGDQDGVRPSQIVVRLTVNGLQSEDKAVTLNADNGWRGEFTDLPKYDENNQRVTYGAVELDVDGAQYSSAMSGHAAIGITFTNTHEPEKTSVEGSKTWVDADNQDESRPDSIVVKLLADGQQVDEKTVTEADGWKWSFTDLDKYADGQEISYTVEESDVAGYMSSIEGFDIVNTATVVHINKVDIADGEELDGAQIQVLDEQGGVVAEWTSAKGEVRDIYGLKPGATYTLHEAVAPDGYAVAADTTFVIDGQGNVTSSGTVATDEDGDTIMLVEDARIDQPEEPGAPGDDPKKEEKATSANSTPKTGDSLMAIVIASLAGAAASIGALLFGRRKRRHQE